MKKITKPKNKILSKRVVITLGIVVFLFVAIVLFKISSIGVDLEEPERKSQEDKSEEVGVENGEDMEDFFDIFGNYWIWMLLGAGVVYFNKLWRQMRH